MPDVAERPVTAVTTVSVTSLVSGPMRRLTSDEHKSAPWVDREGCIMLDDTVRVEAGQNRVRWTGNGS